MRIHDINEHDSDDLLERSLAAMRDASVPEGPAAKTTADTLAALRRAAGDNIVRSRSLVQRILAMTFAQRIAAAVMLTIGGLVMWFMLTLFSTVTYADVAKQIRAVHSLSCAMTITMPGLKEPLVHRLFFQDPGHQRFEGPGNRVSIMDHSTGEMLTLDPAAKTATVTEIARGHGGIERDIVGEFRKLADGKGEPIGGRLIDGVKAKGFRVMEQGRSVSVWADTKTGVPLRVEMSVEMGGQSTALVLSEIVFDPKLDQSLFSLQPPKDYQLTRLELHLPPNLEAAIIGLLRAHAKKAHGTFPVKLDDWGALTKLVTGDNQGKPSAEDLEMLTSAGALTGLMFSLEKGKDYDYRPGAKLGDADTVVFWHRDQAKGTYRAVYGDLSVKDLKAQDVPPPVKEDAVPNLPPPTPVPTDVAPAQPAKRVPAPVVPTPPVPTPVVPPPQPTKR